MPWKSLKQERWGNSASGKKALGEAGVAEWNAATKGKKLPKYTGEAHSYDSTRPKNKIVSRYK